MARIVKICQNCQKLLKMVEIVKNYQNCCCGQLKRKFNLQIVVVTFVVLICCTYSPLCVFKLLSGSDKTGSVDLPHSQPSKRPLSTWQRHPLQRKVQVLSNFEKKSNLASFEKKSIFARKVNF